MGLWDRSQQWFGGAGAIALAVAALWAGGCGGDRKPSPPSQAPTAGSPASPAAKPQAAAPTAAAQATAAQATAAQATAAALPPPPEPEDDEGLDDAPHVDRRLRLQIEPVADVIPGVGFVIEGVPDDVTFYWPVKSSQQNVYIVFDEGFDHVATIEERPRSDGGTPVTLDADALTWTPTPRFSVWPSSFAASQTKQGPGRQARLRGPAYEYRIETLVDLPWLIEGFTFRGE